MLKKGRTHQHLKQRSARYDYKNTSNRNTRRHKNKETNLASFINTGRNHISNKFLSGTLINRIFQKIKFVQNSEGGLHSHEDLFTEF